MIAAMKAPHFTPFVLAFGLVLTASFALPLSAQAKECAKIYEHVDYEGMSWSVSDGDNINWIGDTWNDMISSFKVRSGCSFTIYEHARFEGAWQTFTSNVRNAVDARWNDYVSSYTCVCAAPEPKPAPAPATDTWSRQAPFDHWADGYHFTNVKAAYLGNCLLKVTWTFQSPTTRLARFQSRVEFKEGSWVRSDIFQEVYEGSREYSYVVDSGDAGCWAARPAHPQILHVSVCYADGCTPPTP